MARKPPRVFTGASRGADKTSRWIVFEIPDIYPLKNLSYEFLGMPLENPFILAASPSTDDLDMVRRAFSAGWAGAILKTTSIEGNPVNLAYPMMTSFTHEGKLLFGMGNIDLISVHHIDRVEQSIRTLKKEFPGKMIAASIMAGRKEDWQRLVERLERAGADMIECSFSCPQGNIGEDPGKMLAQSVRATETTARWVKEASRRVPISIKITPHVTDIVDVANAVKRSGCDALTASNSLQALMGVDLRTFVPYPRLDGGSTYSGLTGPAIKPITLRTIAEIARHVDIPILGTGGASSWSDAVEFMAVGAGVVQFCTVVMHHGFRVIEDLRSGMAHYLEEMGFSSPAQIVGRALPHIVSHDDLPRQTVRSQIDEATCIQCEVCYLACRDGGHGAIDRTPGRVPRVDRERCVGCGLCEHVCPEGCISMTLVA
jgi:dihydropyrimidine dehydrogenase (NAD+) subunit PreA